MTGDTTAEIPMANNNRTTFILQTRDKIRTMQDMDNSRTCTLLRTTRTHHSSRNHNNKITLIQWLECRAWMA